MRQLACAGGAHHGCNAAVLKSAHTMVGGVGKSACLLPTCRLVHATAGVGHHPACSPPMPCSALPLPSQPTPPPMPCSPAGHVMQDGAAVRQL